jgi:putative multiple sugar transport system permease protein
MFVLDGLTISNISPTFHNLAAGFLPNVFGSISLGGTSYNLTALILCALASLMLIFTELRKRRAARIYEAEMLPMPFLIAKLVIVIGAINLFGYWFALFLGIPNMLVLLTALILIYSFIAENTVAGRHIYATGGNAHAADLNGIKTKRVVFWVYVNMGILAALAGIMFASRLNAASARAEAGFELQAIAAAFIGGASPFGGIGKVTGAIIGAMLMGVLNNGLSHLGIGSDVQLAITGAFLLVAVAFDIYTKKSKSGKIQEQPKAKKA